MNQPTFFRTRIFLIGSLGCILLLVVWLGAALSRANAAMEESAGFSQTLSQQVAQVQERIAAEQDRRDSLSADLDSLRTTIEDTQQAIIAAEQAPPHPDLARLQAEAAAAARAEHEAQLEAQFAAQRNMLRNRLENMDLAMRQVHLRLEQRFGQHLRRIGISGQRYERILDALVEGQLEYDNMSLSLRAGTITQQEFTAITQGQLPAAKIRELLSEEEYEAFAQEQQGSRASVAERQSYVLLRQLTPDLPENTRDLINAVYHQEMSRQPQTSDLNSAEARSRAATYTLEQTLPNIERQLRQVLSEEEVDSAKNFLDLLRLEQESQRRLYERTMR